MMIKKTLLLTACLASLASSAVGANIITGQIFEFTGPDDLNLDPSRAVIAVDLFGDEDRDVNGVTFFTDGKTEGGGSATANGVTMTTTASGKVNDRKGAPAFTGADATSVANLSAIMHDLRFEFSPDPLSVQILGLDNGMFYDISLLSNEGRARGANGRFWDISVNGELVVDNMGSEGDGGTWTADNSFGYSGRFAADASGEINILMQQQIGGDDPIGADNNPLVQAIIVQNIPEPATGLLAVVGAFGLLLRRRRYGHSACGSHHSRSRGRLQDCGASAADCVIDAG